MKVRGHSYWPPLVLAPMAGVTHSVLRTTILGFGGIGLLSTEMLAANKLPRESPASPFLVRTALEKPLSYQLLVIEEKAVAPAIARLHRLGADAVDINLGCPAPRVRKAGGGSSLLEDSQRVRRIVATARQETELPLSAKIRLGETFDEARLRDVCRMLEGEGIDLLTVHARLRRESFCRKPHWQWVGKVKQWVTLPVVANGGIDSVSAARECLRVSGADGLMIGRAAAARPWLFAEIARALYQDSVPEPEVCLPILYCEYLQGLIHRFRPERRLGRLKEFTHYFASNYFFGHHLASRVQSSRSLADAWLRAVAFFNTSDQQGLAAMRERYGEEVSFAETD